jgi:4-hydroxy-tetrahydrodipicolinate reductase
MEVANLIIFFTFKITFMKIALLGYGKMGKTIEKLALQAGHEIVFRIGSKERASLDATELKKADVVIEFTQPESAVSNLLFCLEAGMPVVSGTTGWYHSLPAIQESFKSQNGSLVYASNFSVGVNLFLAINEKTAAILNTYSDYKVTIDETHHTQKKDAPSGTAITIQQTLQPFYPSTSIPIIDHRVDPVIGIHTVSYKSKVDTISVTHDAHSREGFAAGALVAAEWILTKKGCYRFREVLGL